MNGPLGLEHPLVTSRNLDALAERYRALGFAPTRKGLHPWGTGTQLVLFPDNFIELMGIENRALIDHASADGFRFGRFIADFLARREGIAMIALHSDDAKADLASVSARGVANRGLVDFRRDVVLPDGSKDQAVVSLAMLIDERPQLSHFICQQHRPEFVWVRDWMDHPNGSDAIGCVTYTAARPDEVRPRFAGIWGDAALTDIDGGFRVATAGGDFFVLDHAAAAERFAPTPLPEGSRDAPCAISIAVRVPDLDRVQHILAGNQVPFHHDDRLLRVPPSHAGNVILEFRF